LLVGPAQSLPYQYVSLGDYTTFAQLYNTTELNNLKYAPTPFFGGNAVTANFTGTSDNNPTIAGFYNTVYAGALSSNGCVAVNGYENGVTSETIRDWSDGTVLKVLGNSQSLPSLDGKYYADLNNTQNLAIYDLANGSSLTTLSEPLNVYDLQWAAGDRLLAMDGSFVQTGNMVVQDFNGTTATPLGSMPSGSRTVGNQLYGGVLSPNGKYVAIPDSNGTGVQFYNAATGATLFDIPAETTDTQGISDVSFSSGQLVCLQEVTPIDNISYNEFRVFNIASTTPVLVHKTTVALPTSIPLQGADAVISPDGTQVVAAYTLGSTPSNPLVTGAIQFYNASTGAMTLSYSNQCVAQIYDAPESYYSPNFEPTFGFSPDSKKVIWMSDGALIAAPVGTSVNLALSPASVPGGVSSKATVVINPAPTQASSLSLASSSSAATVPSAVSVAANQSAVTFTVTTSGVAANTSATITATFGTIKVSAVISILPAVVSSISFAAPSVEGGTNATGTVKLNGSSPTVGLVVKFASSSTDLVVPASITLTSGKTAGSTVVTTKPVSANEAITITAATGSTSVHTTLTLTPALLSAFRLTTPTIIGGASEKAAIYLNGLAGASGDTVTISSNNVAATVPATVVVPAGATAVNFPVTSSAVSSKTAVTLSATFGPTQFNATLTLSPAPLSAITLSPAAVIGGVATHATVTLGGFAGPSGNMISITSNSASAVIPATATVLAGKSSAVVAVTTVPVSATTTATITASFNGVSKTTSLVIEAPALTVFRLSSATLTGGKGMNVAVYLNGPAGPGGATVNISSSSPTVIVPTSVIVPAGATAFAFPITSSKVGSNTPVTLTALRGLVTLKQTLTLTP
jgi:hypothetical protein